MYVYMSIYGMCECLHEKYNFIYVVPQVNDEWMIVSGTPEGKNKQILNFMMHMCRLTRIPYLIFLISYCLLLAIECLQDNRASDSCHQRWRLNGKCPWIAVSHLTNWIAFLSKHELLLLVLPLQIWEVAARVF